MGPKTANALLCAMQKLAKHFVKNTYHMENGLMSKQSFNYADFALDPPDRPRITAWKRKELFRELQYFRKRHEAVLREIAEGGSSVDPEELHREQCWLAEKVSSLGKEIIECEMLMSRVSEYGK